MRLMREDVRVKKAGEDAMRHDPWAETERWPRDRGPMMKEQNRFDVLHWLNAMLNVAILVLIVFTCIQAFVFYAPIFIAKEQATVPQAHEQTQQKEAPSDKARNSRAIEDLIILNEMMKPKGTRLLPGLP